MPETGQSFRAASMMRLRADLPLVLKSY